MATKRARYAYYKATDPHYRAPGAAPLVTHTAPPVASASSPTVSSEVAPQVVTPQVTYTVPAQFVVMQAPAEPVPQPVMYAAAPTGTEAAEDNAEYMRQCSEVENMRRTDPEAHAIANSCGHEHQCGG